MLPSKKICISIIIAFILMPMLGVFINNTGTFISAKYLGKKLEYNYNGVSYCAIAQDDKSKFFDSIKNKYSFEISNNKPFPNQEIYYSFLKKQELNGFIICLGAPLLTIILGLAGFACLLFNLNKKGQISNLTIWQWCCVFASLLWIRMLVLLVAYIYCILFKKEFIFYLDEANLAYYLKIPISIFIAFLSSVAFAILSIIFFVLLPRNKKMVFFFSSLIVCAIGYIFWFKLLGPIILP